MGVTTAEAVGFGAGAARGALIACSGTGAGVGSIAVNGFDAGFGSIAGTGFGAFFGAGMGLDSDIGLVSCAGFGCIWVLGR